MSVKLILSYVSDWLTLIAFAAVAYVMNGISPNMHPFSLDNETISYPFTESETVPVWMAYLTNGAAPAVAIVLVSLILVPGSTVPRGTPRRMIWQRKLWELHIGLLGFCLAQCAAMFVTNGLKNMIGKPRPDLLSRCDPDLDEKDQFTVGTGLLVSHLICRQTDKHKLDDGFRSWPSGHSSTSAAGLLYLSLFLASKFTVTIPFVTPAGYSGDESHESVAAFPSRTRSAAAAAASMINDPESRIASHSRAVLAVRRQAAAPPLYLFGICLVPFSAAVFIACSRWFDYRHHAFDIFTGFLIGTVAAVLGFRYYHMPLSQGAGWAWGPRSDDKAFWAGVGSYSFATDKKEFFVRPGDEEEAIGLGGIGGAGSEDRGNPVSMRQGAGGSIANGTGSDPWGEGGRI